ncbi:chloride channel protein [Aestuariispira insulae]|uniref:CIC family chloride channel protein n=1 Tax=Aestuariispira insulae TaxID=1461337 RepID=A0A3D9HXB2_9PROT|nr:chloride channel protein [Aestuariispira insulae]RED54134.1 CIC family chloride channel protein [Aestuariispira insulae]
MKTSFRELLRNIRRVLRHEQVVLAIVAIAVGLMGGGAAILFREAISLIQEFIYGYGDERLASHIRDHVPWWQVMLAPALGGLLVGTITFFFMPGRRPHGVADVIRNSALRGGRMRLRTGLGAALVSALTLGFGGSAGREGPVVHLAASFTSFISEQMKMGRSMGQTLLGCGVAAGVAASFNAPFAGIFFALEVVTGNYAIASFTPVVISAVAGTLVSRAYYGDVTAFVIPEHAIASFWEFPAFAILGIVSAVVAASFIWSVGVVKKTMVMVPVPKWGRPALGGLAVGMIALLFPQVLGVGYEATDQALNEELTLALLITLVVVKTAATAITLGSGFGGGVFSPSLFLGAMVGGAFGLIATEVFPTLSSGHGAYTIVGMGAVAGAVLGAPISTILMVFELTGDYTLTVAVMISTVIASQIVIQGLGHSFFHWQLKQWGVNLSGGRESRIMRSRRTRSVMRHDFITISPDAPINEIRQKLMQCRYGEIFLVDEKHTLLGTIMLQDLSDAAFDHSKDEIVKAQDVARMNPPVIAIDEDMENAMTLLETCGEEHVAVVDNKESKRLVGVLHERDIMAAYHHAVLETRASERL